MHKIGDRVAIRVREFSPDVATMIEIAMIIDRTRGYDEQFGEFVVETDDRELFIRHDWELIEVVE